MALRDIFTCLMLSTFAIGVGAACSGSSDSGGTSNGPPGCSAAPDCGKCGQCFDTCLCASGDANACLAQCAPGTGGAATGGSGGAAVGGSGGTPTGGAGGGGNLGGGPSGGTGGGSGGGTGNCTQLGTGDPGCDSCIHSQCCSQIDNCLASPGCVQLINCLSQNCSQSSNPSACAQQYCGQYLGAAGVYNEMGQCIQGSCSGSC
jgi:hypothetical protein